jgi:undecaprenyl diphosphate synthase
MSYTLENFHPKADANIKHLGLIPDGFRRWAKREECSLSDSYQAGMQKMTVYLDELYSENCQIVSIYLSSIQILRRSHNELSAFYQSTLLLCDELLPKIVEKHNVSVSAVGKLSLLPSEVQSSIKHIENLASSSKSTTRLNLCMAYSPLDEVIHAMNSSSHPNDFIQNLWVTEPVDLIIRTGGANVLSNFLSLQSGYARFYVLQELFNDTDWKDILLVIDQFRQLTRLYGT